MATIRFPTELREFLRLLSDHHVEYLRKSTSVQPVGRRTWLTLITCHDGITGNPPIRAIPMTDPPTNIRALQAEQVLEVSWPDERVDRLAYRLLRSECPCASCRNEWTG